MTDTGSAGLGLHRWVSKRYAGSSGDFWPFILPNLGFLRHHPPRPLPLLDCACGLPALARTPSISIVTPSFNQGHFLEATLQSVLSQNYPNLEYIVQDGASTDGSLAILEAYRSRLAHGESLPDAGQADAINRGFARSSGEIMGWLNSDDLLMPGALRYIGWYFDQHPAVDVIYSHRLLVDEAGREVGRWVLPPHHRWALRAMDFIPQETLFWRRRIWQAVGARVDNSFRFAIDWDLLLRFQDAGARFVRVPRFLGAFRVHAAQKTSAQLETIGREEGRRLRERNFGRPVSRSALLRHYIPYLLEHKTFDLAHRLHLLRYGLRKVPRRLG